MAAINTTPVTLAYSSSPREISPPSADAPAVSLIPASGIDCCDLSLARRAVSQVLREHATSDRTLTGSNTGPTPATARAQLSQWRSDERLCGAASRSQMGRHVPG